MASGAKERRGILVGLGLLLSFSIYIIFAAELYRIVGWGVLNVPKLPGVNDIKRISVKLFNLPFKPAGTTFEFDLPSESYSDFLAFVTPGDEVDFKREFVNKSMIGDFEIHTNTGRKVRIELFWWGKNPATFFLDKSAWVRAGEYNPIEVYDEEESYLAESLTLASYLIAVHDGDTEKAQSLSKELAISAGRLPLDGVDK